MNSRSKKYFEDFNALNEASTKKDLKTIKKGQHNPAIQKTSPNQDDTGGGNDSGKRSDDN